MNSVRDIVKFLEGCDNGASLGELVEEFKEEALVRVFLRNGIDDERIFTEGKKRGVRYFAKGKIPKDESDESPKSKVVNTIEKFGRTDLDTIEFLKSGTTNASDSHTVYSRIGIKRSGSTYTITKANAHSGTLEVDSFKFYDDLREQVRIMMGV